MNAVVNGVVNKGMQHTFSCKVLAGNRCMLCRCVLTWHNAMLSFLSSNYQKKQTSSSTSTKSTSIGWKGLAGLLGLALVPLIVRLTKKKLEERVAEYPPVGQILPLPSGPTHIITAGNPEHPPLLLVHGSDGVALDWPMCPLWDKIKEGRYLIAVDRPGHGHTPVTEREADEAITVACNSQRLKELLHAMKLKEVTILAHSYGAPVSLKLAHDDPELVRSLILLAPLGTPTRHLTRPVSFIPLVAPLGWLLTRLLILPVGDAILKIEGRNAFFPHTVPLIWHRMMRAFSLRRMQVLALACENRNIHRELRELEPLLERIQQRVDIFFGPCDRLVDPEQHARLLAKKLPNSQCERLEQGGHELHWSHPDEIAALVQVSVPAAKG